MTDPESDIAPHSAVGVAALIFAMLSGAVDLLELLRRQHRITLRSGGLPEFLLGYSMVATFVLAAISVKLALGSVRGRARIGFKILGIVASTLSVLAAVSLFAYQDIGFG